MFSFSSSWVLGESIAPRAPAGCTAHPTAEWLTQQARQLTWTLHNKQDEQQPIRFLSRDRDTKFTAAFDRVFLAEGIESVRTPYRTPQANGFAERWIRSVRSECLDHLLIVSEAHLRSVMREYIDYYNEARPQHPGVPGIEQRCPIPITKRVGEGSVKRRDVPGGIVHDYYCDAAYSR